MLITQCWAGLKIYLTAGKLELGQTETERPHNQLTYHTYGLVNEEENNLNIWFWSCFVFIILFIHLKGVPEIMHKSYILFLLSTFLLIGSSKFLCLHPIIQPQLWDRHKNLKDLITRSWYITNINVKICIISTLEK